MMEMECGEESYENAREEAAFHAMRPAKLFANIDARDMLNKGLIPFDNPIMEDIGEENFNQELDEYVYTPNSEENIERRNEFTSKPYNEIASIMTCIDHGELIKKKIVREGSGERISANSIVVAGYKLFKEKCSEAFDSTWKPKSNNRFNLADGVGILPGLVMSLRSMKVGEVSYFLICSSLMYGKFGHPPRVGPNEKILAEIEMLECTAASTYVEPDSYFSVNLFQQVFKLKNEAKVAFKNGNKAVSASRYKNALVILEQMNTDCELTSAQKEALIKTIRINLAVVYNDVNKPSEALQHCKVVVEKDADNKKALFHYGRALLKLGDFREAIKSLRKCLDLDPENRVFQAELQKASDCVEARDKTMKQQMASKNVSLF